jgi:alkanesulfonate monooxygenase SsuD/methylene tetrahydromethanopterin reductase-like flavin-dependent oxidoreductase (luciferase family)
MITKFNTVYAGHVDIPDGGQNATPANERRFSNEHLAGVFSKTEAIARLMDETGWDTLWMAEHHFQNPTLTAHSRALFLEHLAMAGGCPARWAG